jgi:hypothetical protein
MKLTQFQAEEMLHKLVVLSENEDAELSYEQKETLLNLLTSLRKDREIEIPEEIREAVCEEMQNHLEMLLGIPNHDHPFAAIRSIEQLIKKLSNA